MNLKLKILTFFILFNFIPLLKVSANSKIYEKDKLEALSEKIDYLEEKIEYQNEQINSQAGMLDTAFDGVSTELGASSNYISVCSIIIAIFSIGLGIYVTKIEKSIKSMVKDSETLMARNIEIKNDIESLSNKITRDSRGLYKIIRNEESNHLIDRLIFVPEDITNLFYNLTSRDLEPNHFPKLKEAYLQVKNTPEYGDDYQMLLFQHFVGQSFLDEELKNDIIDNVYDLFENSFKNDAIKSSKDFFSTISQLDIENYKLELNKFVTGFCKSKFSTEEAIYFEIINSLKSRELKFKIFKI
ncbi:hypothetical protein, partial [Flavobacterium tructae]